MSFPPPDPNHADLSNNEPSQPPPRLPSGAPPLPAPADPTTHAALQNLDWVPHPEFWIASNTAPRTDGVTNYGQRPVGNQHDAADTTSFHPGQAHWTERYLKQQRVLAAGKPPADFTAVERRPTMQAKGVPALRDPETGEVVRTHIFNRADATAVRDLPLLPARISSNVEMWRVEAWRRLDPRIRWEDIMHRMQDHDTAGDRNRLNISAGRWRRRQQPALDAWHGHSRPVFDSGDYDQQGAVGARSRSQPQAQAQALPLNTPFLPVPGYDSMLQQPDMPYADPVMAFGGPGYPAQTAQSYPQQQFGSLYQPWNLDQSTFGLPVQQNISYERTPIGPPQPEQPQDMGAYMPPLANPAAVLPEDVPLPLSDNEQPARWNQFADDPFADLADLTSDQLASPPQPCSAPHSPQSLPHEPEQPHGFGNGMSPETLAQQEFDAFFRLSSPSGTNPVQWANDDEIAPGDSISNQGDNDANISRNHDPTVDDHNASQGPTESQTGHPSSDQGYAADESANGESSEDSGSEYKDNSDAGASDGSSNDSARASNKRKRKRTPSPSPSPRPHQRRRTDQAPSQQPEPAPVDPLLLLLQAAEAEQPPELTCDSNERDTSNGPRTPSPPPQGRGAPNPAPAAVMHARPERRDSIPLPAALQNAPTVPFSLSDISGTDSWVSGEEGQLDRSTDSDDGAGWLLNQDVGDEVRDLDRMRARLARLNTADEGDARH